VLGRRKQGHERSIAVVNPEVGRIIREYAMGDLIFARFRAIEGQSHVQGAAPPGVPLTFP
jgi:hypothetical protein